VPKHPKMIGANAPVLENYRALRLWLAKHHALCLWQKSLGDAITLEGWEVNGRPIVIELYAFGKGWQLYTAIDSNGVEDTLADAEARVHMEPTLR
jgi:hypothetical protein